MPRLRDQNRHADGRYAPDTSGRNGIASPPVSPAGTSPYSHQGGLRPGFAGAPSPEQISALLRVVDRVGPGGAFVVSAQGVAAPSSERVPEVEFELEPGERLTAEMQDQANARLVAAGWRTWSDGRSNQHRYVGPWLHPSEQMSGAIASDMIAEGGVFAIVYPTDIEGEPFAWGILRRDEFPPRTQAA